MAEKPGGGGGYTEICWRGEPNSSGEMWRASDYRTYFRGVSVDAVRTRYKEHT
jgi:hypothetical protein